MILILLNNSFDSSKIHFFTSAFSKDYSSLELTRSLAKLCQIRRISWIRLNSPDSPFSPNSLDSPKSPLRRYPYLELNRSLAKFRQNRHSRRMRRIRQNRRFVGTPISSSIALWRNFAKIAILAECARFAKIAASLVPLSRAQSLFGEISPKSPFSPNAPDSAKSPLRRYPYLELNRSLAKFRQNRHSRQIRRIRQNRCFVGTPILSSITLWRNFAKIAILAKFAGFAKIAASSVPLSQAQSLFGEISPKSPFSPNSPDLSKSPLRRYPYLELNCSLAKFHQNLHSRRIRRIRFDLWRNFVKIAKFAIACISGHISKATTSTCKAACIGCDIWDNWPEPYVYLLQAICRTTKLKLIKITKGKTLLNSNYANIHQRS